LGVNGADVLSERIGKRIYLQFSIVGLEYTTYQGKDNTRKFSCEAGIFL
jgi:hypothetical protein